MAVFWYTHSHKPLGWLYEVFVIGVSRRARMFELSVSIWQFFRQLRLSFRANGDDCMGGCPCEMKATGLNRPIIIIFTPEMNR